MRWVDEQMQLRPKLPVVVGNVDYQQFEAQLIRIDELLGSSGLEDQFVEQQVEAWIESGKEHARRTGQSYRLPSAKQINRYRRFVRQALRCNIARNLTEKPYRAFSRRVAESPLLQWFCDVGQLEIVKVPSKSQLHRYETVAPEQKVRELVNDLNRLAAAAAHEGGHPLQLAEAADIEIFLADTTCLPANVHFPVDWVLLRDGVRTLVEALVLIRRHGLKHRMPEPEGYLRDINRLSMQMTHSRRKAGAVKSRKKILRKMKRVSKQVAAHAVRYIELLQQRWPQTDLTQRQAQQIIRRMKQIVDRLPQARRQAHERIIGGRKVANAEKLLSLYDPDIHVIVRGKAGAEVEFGNSLYVAEQNEGLIVDWKLYREQAPSDATILEDSLDRMHETFERYPLGVGADRGFARKATSRRLERLDIYDGICPRSPQDLRERLKEEAFCDLQRRRGQTEARIGILKNDFLGQPPRQKGFVSRELAVAWAVLTHNLWVLARLAKAEPQELAQAA
jgi:hypothetical protein